LQPSSFLIRAVRWRKFYSIIDVLKKIVDPKDRANLFNSVVLKAMTYGCETWAPTKRAMERRILGISLRDLSKIRWAGHVARLDDNRWTSRIVEWYPRERKRPLGRPPMRWRTNAEEIAGKNWIQTSKDKTGVPFRQATLPWYLSACRA
ncbi:unnamed protein product, partial [Soboliphyme baturini]|uniref:Endonuclease-reverse transcriptase n=1 Tax=Soboliphyme baturini TaxID=241478 RepID=A0A183J831_9BILA